jgi:dihydroorotate dehydrogenase electron transfer subunit
MDLPDKANKGIFAATVLSNQRIRQCYYRLDLRLDPIGSALFNHVVPGQFLELDLSGTALPDISEIPKHLRSSAQRPVLLRRPFSFSDVSITQGPRGTSAKVQILYCVLGPGSIRMTNLKRDDIVSILGPLGNGFSIPHDISNAILIAGGMGSPPILHLADYLKNNYPKCNTTCFVGAKSSEDFPFTLLIDNIRGTVLDEFERIQVPSYIATDDGSAGYQGFITDHAQKWLRNNEMNPTATVIFGCGPEPMLAATAELAESYNFPCQVSMERMMACGIGLCQSCAVEVLDDTQYHLCCKDGPVFNAKNVVWQAD